MGGTSFVKGVRHPQIGNDVIIGAGAQILGPVKIGNEAKIGSNAVVVSNVEKGQTMVGVPARRTKLNKKDRSKHGEEFSPYATDHGDVLDPNKRDILKLMEEVSELKKELESLNGKKTVKKTTKKAEKKDSSPKKTTKKVSKEK